MHYYSFSISDYRRRTGHLTLLEHAIYRALIDTYYLEEKPLTSDLAKLMRSHSVRNADEKQAFTNVINDFFMLTNEGYKHEHVEEQLAKIYAKSDKARDSANARWGEKPKDNAKVMRTHSERIADGILPINPLTHKPINPLVEQKPTSDEILTFFINKHSTRKLAIEFFNHYRERDWTANNNPIANWQALANKWVSESRKKSPGFIKRHTDKNWADSFIEKHTDPKWRNGL